jgi:glucosamine-6-phosphate deaminase
MRYTQANQLSVAIAETDAELGDAAADAFATAVKMELASEDKAALVMALGAAQDAFFSALRTRTDIQWDRITILHVDTYLGLSSDDPSSGAQRLQRGLLDDVRPKEFIPIRGDALRIEDELARYTRLLKDLRPCVCVVGIGETGHLAFNDPPADFETPEMMRVEELAPKTREQIKRAGIFADPNAIPKFGVTMTMPAIIGIPRILALVHESEKAPIVREIVRGPVTREVPASLLQTCAGATLYVGPQAAQSLS